MELLQFDQIVQLIQLQRSYVSQVNKAITALCCEIMSQSSIHFLHFVNCFSDYVQLQAGSEGYSRALPIAQIYHATMIETLLDSFIVTGAEQLELAITHLECVLTVEAGALQRDLAGLNQRLFVLEELQLKIIALLENLVAQGKEKEFLN